MSHVAEDKAATYQYMTSRPRLLCKKLANSAALRAKASLLRKRVREAIGPDVAFLDLDCAPR